MISLFITFASLFFFFLISTISVPKDQGANVYRTGRDNSVRARRPVQKEGCRLDQNPRLICTEERCCKYSPSLPFFPPLPLLPPSSPSMSMNSQRVGVNVKMDLKNYIVDEAEMQAILSPISPANTLVMGLDVYHGDTSDPEEYSLLSLPLSFIPLPLPLLLPSPSLSPSLPPSLYSHDLHLANRPLWRCVHQRTCILIDTQQFFARNIRSKSSWSI